MNELSVDVLHPDTLIQDTHRALTARGSRLPLKPIKYHPTPQNSPISQQEVPEPQSGSNLQTERKQWKSFCLQTDRQAVVYLGQLLFSFAVLAFCCLQLYTADGDCNRSSPYIGLISFLLGKLLSAVTDSSHT